MVQNTPIFPELTREILRLASTCGTVRTYPKNVILIHEGDQSDSLYIILSGKVKVYLSDQNGKEVLLNILGPEEYFGELGLLDAGPRSASVMTLEKSQLSVISKAGFEHCLAAHPEITVKLMSKLARRFRGLIGSVKSLALLDVYGRIAHTLLSLATEQNDKWVIQQRLTHQDIADMVGASREMVSRIMKDLKAGGHIEVKNKQIVIPGKLPSGW